ncbi:MAG: response regulator [Myxococcales bacterium]|nr:response regulator [Myxococcales bacterium]
MSQTDARIRALEVENRELNEQVKSLVQTEHRWTRSQTELDRQLTRVGALSAFALASSALESPLVVIDRAASLLEEWFAIDTIVAVGDADTLLEPTNLRFVEGLSLARSVDAAPWVGAVTDHPLLLEAVTRVVGAPPVAGTVGVVIPIGHTPVVSGLLAWSCPCSQRSFFVEAPGERHRPFLALLHDHLDRALRNIALTKALEARTHELGQRNEQLANTLVEVERAQHRLAEASKLEAIGRLAGGIAHDFNNLLTVILANASMLDLDLEEDSPHREQVTPIIDAADQARRITQQLLAFSRRQELRPQRLSLNNLLEGFAKILARLIGEHVHLRLHLDPGVGDVMADRTRIEQAIMNLVVNARDAMPEGGALTIETRAASAEEVRAAGGKLDPSCYLALEVSDTGVGMAPETQARIFEPFFSSQPTAVVGKGTGLGLAIVHGVVEQSGGHVLVDSQLGRGSRFTVLLPTLGARQVPDSGRQQKTTVLVVDDEDRIRAIVRRILEARGFAVLEARSGEDALVVHDQARRVDLLLTDIVMPGMGGSALARALRDRRPDLRVLFMSGHAFDAEELATDAGFLPKPFGARELLRHLEEVFAAAEKACVECAAYPHCRHVAGGERCRR